MEFGAIFLLILLLCTVHFPETKISGIWSNFWSTAYNSDKQVTTLCCIIFF